MTKITKEYKNVNNGGRERVVRDGDNYFIDSYINERIGWVGQRKVSRKDVEATMRFTNAPENVVNSILA